MIVTFRSKAAGDIIMLGEHAKPLLELAGKSFDGALDTRGVFMPEQLADAIGRIEKALGLQKDPAFNGDDPAQAEQAARYVSLRQRAFPLLDMLRQAQAKNVNVTWES
jgi:hypothetical protein